MKCAECFLEDCHERNTDSLLNYSFTHSFLHSFVSRECVCMCVCELRPSIYYCTGCCAREIFSNQNICCSSLSARMNI